MNTTNSVDRQFSCPYCGLGYSLEEFDFTSNVIYCFECGKQFEYYQVEMFETSKIS